MRLTSEFYLQPALTLAPLLLGKILCRAVNSAGSGASGGTAVREIIRARIVETEAYCGEADTACHAHKGLTPRTKVMYEKGGTAYVYLCYGIHFLFNVVAAGEGEPEAVLIRGVECAAGPGRVTKAMKIDKSLNGVDMTVSEELWLEDNGTPGDGETLKYAAVPRVGIDYASEEDRAACRRYYII